MSVKTKEQIEKQIADEKARLEKLKKQLKAKEKVEAERARKERNHRLITIGAEVEKYCGEIKNLEAFSNYIRQYQQAIRGSQKDYLE